MLPANQMELTFGLPDEIFSLSKKDMEERAEGSTDLYILDDNRFFVRGLLPLPIENQNDYCLGAWAEVSEKDFERIEDLWDTDVGADEPRIKAILSNSMPYTLSNGLTELEIQLQDSKSRPLFYVTSKSCTLYDEQSNGISSHRAYEYTTYTKKDKFSVFEEEELESSSCDCCETEIKLFCGRVENQLGDVEADYWLRIPTGHPNKFTVAISISKNDSPRVAVLYGENNEENLTYWIQDLDNSPWEDFGDYGKVIGRNDVLVDQYKAFYFDVIDKISATDSRLKAQIS
ncbi:MAG: DUF2199 domain-containing protein [Colwellia sp.]|nr:DUF2199 domain-containing protein [Colwellia sp.]